ncbi:phosphotransferase enzyme family protein [Brachybacterium sp. YJGR34]|uniref:phosphotransferase enzyme family protein n=1 Tax=Brachybacterium sp. YJGR34 TaxID=2059911 RepID=UPI000E0A975B|nr:phosphotransferase [Brachybacterium sp. YJGR34]
MLPEGLSMLWESDDPELALRDRFGLADLAEAERFVRTVLAETWDLRVASLRRVVISDHNALAWVTGPAGELVVKWSRAVPSFPTLEASTRLLAHLAAQGIPVAAPLPSRSGEVRTVLDGPRGPLSVAVLPEVSGDWLDVADLAAVHDTGAVLARLHAALAGAPPELRAALTPSAPGPTAPPGPTSAPAPAARRPAAEDPSAHLSAVLGRWLAESDPGRAPAASRRLSALLAEAPRLRAPAQLVHHDIRAANILIRDSRVVAVLDLDEVEPAVRVDDLARASTYLATLFRDWGPTPAAARGALRAGYETVAPLDQEEAAWLEILTLWYGIIAFPAHAEREQSAPAS